MRLVLAETVMDSQAYAVKLRDWLHGLRKQGFKGGTQGGSWIECLDSHRKSLVSHLHFAH